MAPSMLDDAIDRATAAALPYLPAWWTSASRAAQLDNWMCAALVGSMLPAALVLLAGVQAPYGRYSSRAWGVLVNGKLAWILQEMPSIAIPVAFACATRASAPTSSLANRVLLGAFCAHYLNRTFIFPMLIRGGKPTPLSVFMMALGFCMTNGWVQARALTVHHTYPDAWLTDPRFVLGLALFAVGMAINIHADLTLIRLRKPGETGYKVPRGGAFELVSGANFFGECLEWTGFAIACWSFPACAFAVSVWCNIGPRALQHHQWYLSKFEDYPKHRRALIPFLL
ncbi:hypothetical protein KFE25_002609 [Diacronema lutheri]|uniref:3-oxo-5-alpha-steroid 4-dehydrogenase 1 n=1 Tax=Diacronema lutheri TaxID=2081491 RepID=A0A8J5XNP3_DIALT|nr:hypothetical protein KFE25_002609 [Diacronema lutheri]